MYQATNYTYDDANLKLTATRDRLNSTDSQVRTITCWDGLGREFKTVSGTGASGSSMEAAGRQYDGFGRQTAVSNPTGVGSADCTPLSGGAWTQTAYDVPGPC